MLLRLAAASLAGLAAAGCTTTEANFAPQPAVLASAEAGERLTAAAGETVYEETSGVWGWDLVLDAPARIAGYEIDAGRYAMIGSNRSGYFFAPGDACAGEASVDAARIADPAASLYVEPGSNRLCVVTVYDYRRCGEAAFDVLPAPSDDALTAATRLIYSGFEPSGPGGPGRAAFVVERAAGPDLERRTLTVEIPGRLDVAGASFQVEDASADRVALIALAAPPPEARLSVPPLGDAMETETFESDEPDRIEQLLFDDRRTRN